MDRDEAIKELRRVKRQRERAEAARKDAAKATRDAIVAALGAEIAPSVIASECGVTDSHVRAVRRAAKLPANPSYASLKPPVRTKPPEPTSTRREPEPSPAVRQPMAPTWEELPDRFRKLPSLLAADTVARIRRECPTWHDETCALIADALPEFRDGLEIKRAADAGILDDLGIVLP